MSKDNETLSFGKKIGGVLWLVTLVWLFFMIILPQLLMVEMSFHTYEAADGYTLQHYESFLTNQQDQSIFLKTIVFSIVVTLTTLLVCYPIAYFIRLQEEHKRGMLLVALIIPFWINEILRTFAWFLMLSKNGLLNQILLSLGWVEDPLNFGGNASVLLAMVYSYVLFMIFPLYNAFESLDMNLTEAARNLGAGRLRTHWRIVIPHAKSGIGVGCIMVFMLSAGTFAVPQMMQNLPGSTGSRWFTQIIYSWFFDGGDWNRGSAYSFLLLLLCTSITLVLLRVFHIKIGDFNR